MILLVDYIRLFSKDGRLVTPEHIVAVAGLDNDIENVEAQYQALTMEPRFSDIQLIKDGEQYYLYSSTYIVKSYAEQWLGVNSGHMVETMMRYIRRYSSLGALVTEDCFTHPPYNLDTQGLAQLTSQFLELVEGEDICYQVNNEGIASYFSTRYISQSYASVLANHDPFEWSA